MVSWSTCLGRCFFMYKIWRRWDWIDLLHCSDQGINLRIYKVAATVSSLAIPLVVSRCQKTRPCKWALYIAAWGYYQRQWPVCRYIFIDITSRAEKRRRSTTHCISSFTMNRIQRWLPFRFEKHWWVIFYYGEMLMPRSSEMDEAKWWRCIRSCQTAWQWTGILPAGCAIYTLGHRRMRQR